MQSSFVYGTRGRRIAPSPVPIYRSPWLYLRQHDFQQKFPSHHRPPFHLQPPVARLSSSTRGNPVAIPQPATYSACSPGDYPCISWQSRLSISTGLDHTSRLTLDPLYVRKRPFRRTASPIAQYRA